MQQEEIKETKLQKLHKKLTFKNCLILVVFSLVSYQVYLFLNPYAYVNFVVYQPKDAWMTDKVIYFYNNLSTYTVPLPWLDGGLRMFPNSTTTTYTTTVLGNNIDVGESKNDNFNFSCDNINLKLESCEIKTAKDGQEYIMSGTGTITFIKGDTLMRAFSADVGAIGAAESIESTWSDVVDSFEPVQRSDVHYFLTQWIFTET